MMRLDGRERFGSFMTVYTYNIIWTRSATQPEVVIDTLDDEHEKVLDEPVIRM